MGYNVYSTIQPSSFFTMNKLTLSALMASFLLISACGESADDTADADKSVMDSAVEMTEHAAESISDSTSNAYDATKEMAEDVAESTSEVIDDAVDATTEMANDVADSAIEMKDKMMEEDKTED